MKKYRVNIELTVEAYSQDQAVAIANGASARCWYHENVKECMVEWVTEMDNTTKEEF